VETGRGVEGKGVRGEGCKGGEYRSTAEEDGIDIHQ
jgi:hypothetical protein